MVSPGSLERHASGDDTRGKGNGKIRDGGCVLPGPGKIGRGDRPSSALQVRTSGNRESTRRLPCDDTRAFTGKFWNTAFNRNSSGGCHDDKPLADPTSRDIAPACRVLSHARVPSRVACTETSNRPMVSGRTNPTLWGRANPGNRFPDHTTRTLRSGSTGGGVNHGQITQHVRSARASHRTPVAMLGVRGRNHPRTWPGPASRENHLSPMPCLALGTSAAIARPPRG